MSIPKIIHYCWFGGNPLGEDAIKCIESWKKYCPDYTICRWDENNFDIAMYPYVKEAYDAKKWAFVTDVVRLQVVYEKGGIYLDTDVELIKSPDSLLEYSGFFGFEDDHIATGLGFGAEPGNPIVKQMLEDYQKVHFIREDGTMDLTPCPARNSLVLEQLGLKCDGSYQVIEGVHFLPREYLCPIDWRSYEYTHMTENTISIHHYNASWKEWYDHGKYKGKGEGKVNWFRRSFVRIIRYISYRIKEIREGK